MRGRDALAAPALPPVGGHREPLDVTRVRDRDHHVFFGDQVFDGELALVGDDLGPARVAEAMGHLAELFLEDLHPAGLGRQDLLALLDELADVLQLLFELVDLEGGEPGEPHVEDFGRLPLRQLEALAQGGVRRGRVLRLPDDLDDLVDVVDGDLQPFEDVLPVLGPLQLELRPAGDDGVAVVDETLQQLLQRQFLRDAVHQRQHDGAEGRLHRGVLVELIQHHGGHRVAFQLDHDPHAFAVRVIFDVRDAFDLLVDRQAGDLRDQVRLVDLIRNLRDHDLLPARLLLFDGGAGADHDAAAALLVAVLDPFAAVNDRAGRKVGAADEFPEILDRGVGMVDQMLNGLDHLAEVVRRDVGRHAHRDAGGAIDDEIRHLGRENGRFLQAVVEVGDELDGVLVDVLQHRHRDPRQPRFRVPVRGRRIAVDGTEIPLPVHQRIPQRELLDHADQGVVDGDVAVRVILAEDVADDRGALLVRPSRHQAELVHRVENPAVYRFQAVAHIGQRALDDHAHRIVEEGFLQLVFDEARKNAFAGVGSGHERQVSGVRSQGPGKCPKSKKSKYLRGQKQRKNDP